MPETPLLGGVQRVQGWTGVSVWRRVQVSTLSGVRGRGNRKTSGKACVKDL
eukprot:CAMPEP_0171924782 /NCGR_PEP_ID=MMETSP0993-20121228/23288_1 /TAXON_ID=483369 /ORGANISM="non described non described, Strain CCMP2098" /LENGTH=50 /DNA_ID=CAMNT_0012563135 /DNA_START=59 /DNA_END=208 /DNA_ORIENTATION=+